MSNVLTYGEFRKSYETTHQAKRPQNPSQQVLGYGLKMAVVFIILVAVNALSAAHTVPIIVNTIPGVVSDEVSKLLGVLSFLGIDFLVAFMFALDHESKLRNFIAYLGLIIAISANLVSVIDELSRSTYAIDKWVMIVIGVLIGLFAPVANAAVGELFKVLNKDRNKQLEKISSDYVELRARWDHGILNAYNKYLDREGILDPTERALLMSNERTQQPLSLPVEQPKPEYSEEIIQLAEQIYQNGDTEMSQKDLAQKYRKSFTHISPAKKLAKEMQDGNR